MKRAGTALAGVFCLIPIAAVAGPVHVVGPNSPQFAAIDQAVSAFMQTENVHNAELAVSEHGRIVFSHAYTYEGSGNPTTPATVFRLASNSKAWTSAAIEKLIQSGAISPGMHAFAYLGITHPLPSGARVDPRVFQITIQNLIDHKSGWDDAVRPKFDPTHQMRTIAHALNLTHAIDRTQMVQYMLGQPLQEPPGSKYAYCNFCYDVLGMIVEKASHMKFEDYVEQNIAAPIGVHNLVVSPTLEPRLPNEVGHYYSLYVGLSAVYVLSGAHFPQPNGGDGLVREVDSPAGGLATNAISMLKLMNHYVIWGVGLASPGESAAREGADEGTNTWAEQRSDGKHWSFLINTRNYHKSTDFDDFTKNIDHLLNSLP